MTAISKDGTSITRDNAVNAECPAVQSGTVMPFVAESALRWSGICSPACIYHDKLYWYEHGSILSDKYIYSCNIEDGRNLKKYDWLSNEKTGQAIGHSYHIVSEDAASEMKVANDSLIITVKRKSIKDAKYMIRVEEIGDSIQISKHILSGDFSPCKDISTFR